MTDFDYRNAATVTIRYSNDAATYELVDPEVVDSRLFGLCFRAVAYRVAGKDLGGSGGLFPLRDAVLIEFVAGASG